MNSWKLIWLVIFLTLPLLETPAAGAEGVQRELFFLPSDSANEIYFRLRFYQNF